nr:probable galacturonosyltransferase 4 [Ipomoea batatas]
MICDVALSLSRWLGSGWLDDIDDVGGLRRRLSRVRTLVAMIPVSLRVVKLRSRVNIFTDVRVHQLGDQVIRAKVYLLLCATTSNPHFMHVLKKAASFAHGKRRMFAEAAGASQRMVRLKIRAVRRVFKDMGGHHLSIHGRSSTVDGGWRRRQQQRTNELLSWQINVRPSDAQ